MPYNNAFDQARAARRHYEANRELVKSRAASHKDKARRRNKVFVWKYLLNHPCVDCGEGDPLVLEFDHRDGRDKNGDICTLVRSACSIQTIRREIAKCEVRCANCHRRKTCKQMGWFVPEIKSDEGTLF